MDIRVVMALNMFDELEDAGDHLDYVSLGKIIGDSRYPDREFKGNRHS